MKCLRVALGSGIIEELHFEVALLSSRQIKEVLEEEVEKVAGNRFHV
jgi:hypothetical protein